MGLKVLVISAHVDDAECGCGGTVIKHIEAGDEIQWHTLIGHGYRVPNKWPLNTLADEFVDAMAVFGIEDYELHNFNVDTLDRITELRNTLFRIWKNYDPDIAYVHWAGSRHQDHRAVGDCARQVSWRSKADVRAYSVLNDFDGFRPTVFSVLTLRQLEKKKLVIGCYKSQFELRRWFTEDLIMAHSRSFGIFADSGSGHAEVFEQIRRVV